jgi:tetratricopeptide (TPR) repeat protein
VNQTLGHIAKLRGKNEDAMAFFEQARLAAPDEPAILNDLVNAQIACRKFADAEVNINKLLARKEYEDRRDLKLERARCLVELQRPLEARDLLIKLTKEENSGADVEVWIELGKVSYKLKDTTRLRTVATRIVAMAPDRPEGYQLRAMMLRRIGALDQAKDNALRAVKIAPTADNFAMLGVIQRQIGDTEGSKLSFAKAIMIEPGHPIANEQLNELRSGNPAAIAGVPDRE